MGNCWAKFRKRKKNNKVGPEPWKLIKESEDRGVSEILSLGSVSVNKPSPGFLGEHKMIEELAKPDDEPSNVSLESVTMENDAIAEMTMENDAIAEIRLEGQSQSTKEPVFFQIDFVQGMRSMPPRLASRMEQRKMEQMTLTDEDEILMDEIMEEFETKEKIEKLQDKLRTADSLRNQHLQSVREKARGMRSRPPTRTGGHHLGDGQMG